MANGTAAKPIRRLVELFGSIILFGGLDFWLWPEIFTEKITFFNNQTGAIIVKEPDFTQVHLYLDDFFDQWHTSKCFLTQTCDFDMFLITYLTYTMATMGGCIILSSPAMPRLGIVLSSMAGSFFNIFHSYVVRGRFLPPDSLVMWGAQFGSLCGPSFYSCFAYLLENPQAQPMVVAHQQP